MTAGVFGTGFQGDITAVFMGAEKERGRPGVINNGCHMMAFRHGGDRRNILHLERLGAGGFKENHGCFRADKRFNPRADQRIIIGGGNAHFCQQTAA
ncbi:hypothetical protein K6U71_18310 [Vibrio alginolyticus]|nr:hypothetical protein [Vibrio alginolyticus]